MIKMDINGFGGSFGEQAMHNRDISSLDQIKKQAGDLVIDWRPFTFPLWKGG